MDGIMRNRAFFGKARVRQTAIRAPDFNPVIDRAFGDDDIHCFPMARVLLEEKP
jgi:hypothetical protein